jgi:hypothetical protein
MRTRTLSTRARVAPAGRAAAILAVALAALTASVGAPVAASAATAFTVRGAGFGHGVGLSQYGAEGMARAGADQGSILGRYYPGTGLGRAPTDRTRVLLLEGVPVAEVSGAGRIPGTARSPRAGPTVRAPPEKARSSCGPTRDGSWVATRRRSRSIGSGSPCGSRGGR